MRACAAQYGRPSTALPPQKPKSRLPGSLIGQRHFPSHSSASEHRGSCGTGTSSTAGGGALRRAVRMSCWVTSRSATLRCRGLAITRSRGARRRRLILPMTALRLTPISSAIWLQDSPASKQLFSCATRAAVHVLSGTFMGLALTIYPLQPSLPRIAPNGVPVTEPSPARLQQVEKKNSRLVMAPYPDAAGASCCRQQSLPCQRLT